MVPKSPALRFNIAEVKPKINKENYKIKFAITSGSMVLSNVMVETEQLTLIAQVDVEVLGLKPETRDRNGNISDPGNLADLAEKTQKIFVEKPWFQPLLDDVLQHKKSAVFITAAGLIIIFVATAAGFEFGIRHGRDLRDLQDILRKKQ